MSIRQHIGGIRIPSAYTLLQDNHTVEENWMRFLPSDKGLEGPFLFNPHDEQYQIFFAQCQNIEKQINTAIDRLLQITKLPLRTRGDGHTHVLARQGKRKLHFAFRPPFFQTKDGTDRSQRMQVRAGNTHFCVHIDEDHVMQTIRRWGHTEHSSDHANTVLDQFSFGINHAVIQCRTDIGTLLQNGEYDEVAFIIARGIQRSFGEVSSRIACPDWYKPSASSVQAAASLL